MYCALPHATAMANIKIPKTHQVTKSGKMFLSNDLGTGNKN
jgi:hypothetical protein